MTWWCFCCLRFSSSLLRFAALIRFADSFRCFSLLPMLWRTIMFVYNNNNISNNNNNNYNNYNNDNNNSPGL